METATPENFIRHPIAHPRKPLLLEQHRLERTSLAPPQISTHQLKGEGSRDDLRWQRHPPVRFLARIEFESPEHPRIAENKGTLGLPDDQMVMTPGLMVFAFDQKFARHPEMQSEARLLEHETHLLPLGLDAGEFFPLQPTANFRWHRRPVNPGPLPAHHFSDTVPEPGCPLLGIKSHLGEFRHPGILMSLLNAEN